MNFLKDPRTNWKYILIVVVLAVIVSGGTLYYYLKLSEIESPSIGFPSKPTIWMNCDELKRLKATESNKLDFSCETDANCKLIPVRCGECVSRDVNTEKYEEIYDMMVKKGCEPVFDCQLVECKCLNNKCEVVVREEAGEINSFEECLVLRRDIGWLDSKTSSLCECDTPDGRAFAQKVENVENLMAKYTDQDFDFSFYYLKSFKISESKPSEYFPAGDIYLTKVGSYDDTIIIRKYLGQRVEDSDAKFGKVAYYYDEDKKQWMKDADTDYEFGASFAEPIFYTVSGLPVFPGVGRWATRIVALSIDKFLIINITGSGWTRILDPLTKTVAKTEQKIDEGELKNLLKEEVCSLTR